MVEKTPTVALGKSGKKRLRKELGTHDDTPRRFRDLMQPKKFVASSAPREEPKKSPTKEVKEAPQNDAWSVRKGETFAEFNARIKMAGLSVPPGVPQTTRSDPGIVRDQKPLKKTEVPEVPQGDKTKKRRKLFMQQRSKVAAEEADDRYVTFEPRKLKDVVLAPPSFPASWKKAALATEKKVNAIKSKAQLKKHRKKRPSLSAVLSKK